MDAPVSKPTPNEIKARNRANKQKPKPVAKKCPECKGSGETAAPDDGHAVRCPACLGSGFVKKPSLL